MENFENIPRFEIIYALALPDWQAHEVTPFQGFAPGLPYLEPMFALIPRLPVDILEPAMGLNERLTRRRSGSIGWLWTPVNLSTMLEKRSPVPEFPYMVVLSGDAKTAKVISEWRKGLRIAPLHISHHAGGGAVNPVDMTLDRLKVHTRLSVARAACAPPHGEPTGPLVRYFAE